MHACMQAVLGICVLYCAFAYFFVGDGTGSMKEADIPLLLVGCVCMCRPLQSPAAP